MRTFSDLANRTGTPILIQTTVPETLAHASHVAYVGWVWVASGGRYWFPPGVPQIESGGGLKPDLSIHPHCIFPFCSGAEIVDGVGGGDPGGDPPAPDKPPTPPPGDAPPHEEGGEDPDQTTQKAMTKTEVDQSQTYSETAQKTTKVSRQTTSTHLLSSSTISSVVMSSSTFTSSTVSSATISAYGNIDLTDGFFVDYELSNSDADAVAHEAFSGIDSLTVPNGMLWVPTGSQELADAALATSSFDLALPAYALFTTESFLPSATIPTQSQSTKSFSTKLRSSAIAIAAIAGQIASSSAAVAAENLPSPTPTPIPSPTTAVPFIILECTQM